MKTITTKNVLLAAVLLCGTALTPHAQIIIFNDNLDTQPSAGGHGYQYGGTANYFFGYAAGIGVGGSEAAEVQTDLTGTPNYGAAVFQYQNTSASGNTSVNLGDYTLSFDAEVNTANSGFTLDVQSFAGPGIQNLSGEGATASYVPMTTPNVFQHLSFNLGQLVTVGSNPLPVPTAQNWQIAFGIQNGMPWNDPSTGDQVIIDNIQLTMAVPVPEPSLLTVCAMGGLVAFAFFRQRKSAHHSKC